MALAKVIASEYPELACSHVDLPIDGIAANAARVVRELGAAGVMSRWPTARDIGSCRAWSRRTWPP